MAVTRDEDHPGKGHVLIVDDDMGVRKVLRYALQGYGYQVEGAEDGLQALSCLQRQQFDVVVTDLHMPRLDGLALLREVRQMGCPPPVVVQTTLLDPTLESLLRRAGAFCVLLKGGPVQELTRVVDAALQETGCRLA